MKKEVKFIIASVIVSGVIGGIIGATLSVSSENKSVSSENKIPTILIGFILGASLGGIVMALKVKKDGKEIKTEEEKEELPTYFDLENELKKVLKQKGIEWNDKLGIYSVYTSTLKNLIDDILADLNAVEEKIELFKKEKCQEIKNIQLDPKFNKMSDPINFAKYFNEENINGVNLTDKIQKLSYRYCEKAVERVKEKIAVDLKYDNKEGIKKTLEEMRENV